MAYNYHGTDGLIALPGRRIATFPSGLVRVDRTYACRTERANAFRQQFAVGTILPFDDGTPAIDGLYIFPDARETQKEDGFTEFKVSAYGRTTTEGYTRREFLQGESSISSVSTVATNEGSTTTQSEGTLSTLNESLIQTFVQLAEQPFLFDIGIQSNSLKIYLSDGRLLTDIYLSGYRDLGGVSYSSTNSGSLVVFGGTTTNNFGRWAEVTITYNSRGFVSTVSYLAR